MKIVTLPLINCLAQITSVFFSCNLSLTCVYILFNVNWIINFNNIFTMKLSLKYVVMRNAVDTFCIF